MIARRRPVGSREEAGFSNLRIGSAPRGCTLSEGGSCKELGSNAAGFGKGFELRARVLFEEGLTDAAIAQALKVNRNTVNRRTKHWRKSKKK